LNALLMFSRFSHFAPVSIGDPAILSLSPKDHCPEWVLLFFKLGQWVSACCLTIFGGIFMKRPSR